MYTLFWLTQDVKVESTLSSLSRFFVSSCLPSDCVTLSAVGEAAAGKASRSLAQHIPGQAGVEGMKVAASGVVGELARARIALDERGQRLGELEERTALMMSSAENFSKHAHEVHFFPFQFLFKLRLR